MADIHSGSCLCGAVRFRANGKLREIVACHCSQCRKQTGLYYAATNAKRADVTIEGEESITWYAASDFAHRGFCATCGSALFWQANEGEWISIMAGAFDTPLDGKIAQHIFCEGRAQFYDIDGDAPQYAESSPQVSVAST